MHAYSDNRLRIHESFAESDGHTSTDSVNGLRWHVILSELDSGTKVEVAESNQLMCLH